MSFLSDVEVFSTSFFFFFFELIFKTTNGSGGHAKTLMFVQLNPDVQSYSETISTLKFAERVSGVELGAASKNKEGRDVKELMDQVPLYVT